MKTNEDTTDDQDRMGDTQIVEAICCCIVNVVISAELRQIGRAHV